MEKNYAPVIIFAYKREEHLKQVMKALKRCELADKTEVFVFIDGPKTENDQEAVKKVQEYAESLYEEKWFLTLNIEKSEINKGLSKSIIGGVTKVINQYKKVIVLEDDIIVKSNFLVYMNKALDFYEKNKSIWSISGFTPQLKSLKTLDDFIYKNYRGSCWGWASWADRWNQIDWEVKDYKSFMFNTKKRRMFNRGGNDLSRMLDAFMVGKISSWAVRWNYMQSKLGMFSIAPRVSLCSNVGFDGSGENCGKMKNDSEELLEADSIGEFHELKIDKKIISEFKQYYDTLYSLKLRLKKKVVSFARRMRYIFKNRVKREKIKNIC